MAYRERAAKDDSMKVRTHMNNVMDKKNKLNQLEMVRNEPTMTGETIYLEGLTLKHVSERYAQWLNDKEVCKENSHGRVHNTIEMTRAYIESVDNAENIAAFAIMTKKENKHIGNISLGNISWENGSGEISILIGDKDYWGKGAATEAYRLVIHHGFDFIGLHRLYSGMTARNKAMMKVCEKAGMEQEGISKEAFFKDGVYTDIVHYGIINPDHSHKEENK